MLSNEERDKIQKMFEQSRKAYEENAESFWDSLSYDDKLKAFYSVVKRMHKAELTDKGTYRYALYDVFRFDFDAYVIGMDCGYLDLHNALCDANEYDRMRKENKIPEGFKDASI